MTECEANSVRFGDVGSAHQLPRSYSLRYELPHSTPDVQPDDLPIFFDQQVDADATRMAGFPSRDRTAFDAHWASNILGNPTGVTQTVLLDGNIAGHIGCWQQDGVRFVGYWIGKEYWGKGVATEALAQCLSIVTGRPLHAHVAKHNLASIRVLEKCGFRLEREEGVEVGGEESAEVVLVLGCATSRCPTRRCSRRQPRRLQRECVTPWRAVAGTERQGCQAGKTTLPGQW